MTVNKEDLKAYIDGELPNPESEAIRHEVEANANLAQEVVFLKLIGQGVRDCAVEIPVSGASETLELFRRKKGFSLGKLAFAVVGVAFLSAVCFPVFSQSKLVAKNDISTATAVSKSIAGEPNVMAMKSKAYVPTAAVNGFPQDGDVVLMKRRVNSPLVKRVLGRNGSSKDISGFSTNSGVATDTTESPATPPSITPGDRNRMVVQNADLDEVVRDVSEAQNEATDYVKAMGGIIQTSSLEGAGGDNPEAHLTARVPAQDFSMAMNHFKSLAIDAKHINTLNITGSDVTSQYADTTARLRVLGAEEDSYVTMLRSARRLGEILEIKDRLSQVREQIESLRSQSESIKNESDLSTINLTFEQQSKPKAPTPKSVTGTLSWSSGSWESAVSGLTSVMKFLASVLIFVFVFSPIWLPIAVIGTWLQRRTR